MVFYEVPKATIWLEDSFKIIVVLDISVEINIMTREIMEDIGLAMRCGPKLKLISHTGHSCYFLGLCKDIEVVIRELKTCYLIYIIEHGDHDLVFGQPF